MALTNLFASIADPVSSFTHLFGAVVFAVMAVPLLRRAARADDCETVLSKRPVRIASVAVFACSGVLLLAVSGLYHCVAQGNSVRSEMLRLDYAAIYILIAGSFTPPIAIFHSGWRRRTLLLVVWTIAVTGVAFRLSIYTQMPRNLSCVVYLSLSWMGALGAIVVARRFGIGMIEPLVISGTVYTAGAAVQMAQRPDLIPGFFGPHELFHVAVLVGLGFHWWFVWQFADGTLPQRDVDTEDKPEGSNPQAAWEGVGGTMP